jgi:hypothetical protein
LSAEDVPPRLDGIAAHTSLPLPQRERPQLGILIILIGF